MDETQVNISGARNHVAARDLIERQVNVYGMAPEMAAYIRYQLLRAYARDLAAVKVQRAQHVELYVRGATSAAVLCALCLFLAANGVAWSAWWLEMLLCALASGALSGYAGGQVGRAAELIPDPLPPPELWPQRQQ